MFHDLKNAFKKVKENLEYCQVCETTSGERGFYVSQSAWKELEQEFNICFVEPEDDDEWELWVENDDVI